MSSLGSFKSYQTHQKNTRDFYMVRLHMPTSMGPRPARTIHYQIRVVNTPYKLKTNKTEVKQNFLLTHVVSMCTHLWTVNSSSSSFRFPFSSSSPWSTNAEIPSARSEALRLPLDFTNKAWNPFKLPWSRVFENQKRILCEDQFEFCIILNQIWNWGERERKSR